MLVKKWMSKNVISVQANDSVIKAQLLLKEHNIKRLPIIEKGMLVGIVTDRGLRILPSETLRVKNVMTKSPVTVPWDYTVGEASEILLQHNISGLPVVDEDGHVIGIITKSDLFKVLVPLTGIGKRGIQFALQVSDRPGAIKEVTDLIREYGGRIMSTLTSHEDVPEGSLEVYIRMHGMDRDRLRRFKHSLEEKATLLYIVDLRENKRDIYKL
jgi:acetoin utilization protein AcuB